MDFLFFQSIKNNVFPGAYYSFSQWNGTDYNRESNVYGFSQLEPQKRVLTKDSVFDLASLTKVLCTTPLLLYFFEKNKINEASTLKDFFPSCPSDKSYITIRQLLSHQSGLAAHDEFFHELNKLPFPVRKTKLLETIFEMDLLAEPGEECRYSDLGFILLGFIIEKIAGAGLATVARKLLYEPLGFAEELYFPTDTPEKDIDYVTTEQCPWSGIMLTGEVHDDNCRALGGVAGHAGLFGTMHGVLSMCEQFLDQWKNRANYIIGSNELLQRILEPVGTTGRTMGFDMVSEEGSSSGHYFTKESVGHLGFTGTSLWIDPVQECIVVLLTNRVHPTRDNESIKKFRPEFHDIVMQDR